MQLQISEAAPATATAHASETSAVYGEMCEGCQSAEVSTVNALWQPKDAQVMQAGQTSQV